MAWCILKDMHLCVRSEERRVDKEYIPNMEAHKEYQFYMDRYMETWPQMREIVHKTVDHNNKK